MNATSRAILQTVLNTDTGLIAPERKLIQQLVEGRIEAPEAPKAVGEHLLLTQKATAKLLSVSRVTVWRMTKDGVLHPIELLPGTWRYSYAEIARLATTEVQYPDSQSTAPHRSAVAA